MKNTIVFALSSSVGLAKDICKELGLELGKCEVKHFADGEILVELEESVRGKSFEHRQITGQVVNGKDISLDTGLVQVSGIYYRYLTSDNSIAEKAAQYAIVDAVGNILTLRKI